jgi:hypothetical protein
LGRDSLEANNLKGGISMNDLLTEMKTSDLVTAYQQMLADLDEAYARLVRIKDLYEKIIGGRFFPCKIGRYDMDLYDHERDKEDSRKGLRINCWKVLFLRIKNLLPAREISSIEKQLSDGNVPEFTEENIHKLMFSFITRGDEFKKQMIEDVFNFLRPQRTGLKTNQRPALKEKAIIPGMIDHNKYWTTLSGYREDSLWDMDKIFHLLDGAGIPKYPGNLLTRIRDAMREKKWQTETEYFECTWHKNGNMHIRFKRMDLVFEINKIAGCDKLNSV